MAGTASIAKHPIHPMLVAFPIGLFVFSFVCDLIYMGTHITIWADASLCVMAGGIVGAILAAVPGLIDFFSITEAEMRSIAMKHMLINVGVLVIFVFEFCLRLRGSISSPVALGLSAVGVIGLGVAGWLGGEMVYVKGMAVAAVDVLSEKLKKSHR